MINPIGKPVFYLQIQNTSYFHQYNENTCEAETCLTAPYDITGRKAAEIQELASSFGGQNDIVIEKESRACNSKSLLGIQSLEIHEGDPISIRVYGEHPVPCLEVMERFFTDSCTE